MHIFCFSKKEIGGFTKTFLISHFPIVFANSRKGKILISYSDEVYITPSYPNHLRKPNFGLSASKCYTYCELYGILLNDYEKKNAEFLLEEINNMTKEEKKELWKKRCF